MTDIIQVGKRNKAVIRAVIGFHMRVGARSSQGVVEQVSERRLVKLPAESSRKPEELQADQKGRVIVGLEGCSSLDRLGDHWLDQYWQ